MKKVILLSAALLALTASLASAQGDIRLGWANCGTAAASRNVNFACDNNTSSFSMFASFRIDNALTKYVGCSSVIDYAVAAPIASTPWWQIDAGCRAGSLAPNPVPPTVSGCTNPYTTTPASNQAGGQVFEASPLPNPANKRRLRVDWAMDRQNDLAGGATRYAGQNLVLNTLNTVDELNDPPGPSPCPGCQQPACFVLNAMEVGSPDLPPPGTLLLTTAANNSVTWQGGAVGGSGCPGETPTRNATWGSIKSMYR
jgi:hypothetical protein